MESTYRNCTCRQPRVGDLVRVGYSQLKAQPDHVSMVEWVAGSKGASRVPSEVSPDKVWLCEGKDYLFVASIKDLVLVRPKYQTGDWIRIADWPNTGVGEIAQVYVDTINATPDSKVFVIVKGERWAVPREHVWPCPAPADADDLARPDSPVVPMGLPAYVDPSCTCGIPAGHHYHAPTCPCFPHEKETAMPEAVNHPAHYGGDTVYEAIKVIEAWDLGFCLGNTVKYISRAGKKAPDAPGSSAALHRAKALEDLKKAAWYLHREIETLSKQP